MKLSFDDVLITPKFSTIKSRKDCDTSCFNLKLPIISSNMDTVTMAPMAHGMFNNGAIGCLHRFMSIADNVKEYKASPKDTWCSIGIGPYEVEELLLSLLLNVQL